MKAVQGQEEDPAVLAGLVPSATARDTSEDEIVLSDVDTLDNLLSKHDAQTLVSYLSVPYIAIPLICSFISQERIVAALFHKRMQSLIDTVRVFSRVLTFYICVICT
jgi:hypothetical protein